MNLITPADIITRLRGATATLLPALSSNIYGAADSDFAEDKSRLPLPNIAVFQGDNTGIPFPSDVSFQTGTQEMLSRNFDILLSLENTDRRGQSADTTSVAFAQFLIQALAGWTNNGNGLCLTYDGDELWKTDKSRYMRIYHFSQKIRFNSNDVSLGDLGDLDLLPWFETIRYTLDNLPETDITLITTEG